MTIAHIAAVSSNACIGKDGTLPWHIPEDMKFFKETTTGHVVLMGRKTWESIPEKFRPLPNRKNIVITRKDHYAVPEGVAVYNSIEAALEAHNEETIFIIGGGQIYTETFPLADELFITHVEREVDGDTFFPDIDPDVWEVCWQDDREGFSFVKYIRKQ